MAHTPLKISVVEPSGQLYGSELALLDIIERLNRSKFQVEVILPRNASFDAPLRKAGVPSFHFLPARIQHSSRWNKSWSYLRVAWHWKQQRPNLIYVNQGGILRPVAEIARRLKLPILCQVQTLEDAKWVSNLTQCQTEVMAFVCNSRFVAAATRVPAGRLCTVYQGYKDKDLGSSKRQPFDSARPLRVGLLGRICRSKGHHLLVEAAGCLTKCAPGQYVFRLIGDALDQEELSDLKALVERLGVSDMIEFRGYRSDIAAELASLDVLAIPSLAEPFGRILSEASEARVLVLVADSGGLGELSHRFGAGVRFRGGDVEDFVFQLQTIRANYARFDSDFKEAAQRLLAALNLSDYVDAIEGLIVKAAACEPTSFEWLGRTPQLKPLILPQRGISARA